MVFGSIMVVSISLNSRFCLGKWKYVKLNVMIEFEIVMVFVVSSVIVMLLFI